MKKILIVTATFFFYLTGVSQDITNTIPLGGSFKVVEQDGATLTQRLDVVDGKITLNASLIINHTISRSIENSSNSSITLDKNSIFVVDQNVTACSFAQTATEAKGVTYTIYKKPGNSFDFAIDVDMNGSIGKVTPTTAHALTITSDGSNWIVRTIGGYGASGPPSNFLSNVRKVNITADGDSFSFLEDDFLIHLTGEKKKINVTLPNAALMPRRIFNISMVEDLVRDMHITFISEGGLINGGGTISKEFHHGDSGFIYIYNDGINWWLLSFDNQHKIESDPVASPPPPVVFESSSVIINQSKDIYVRCNFIADNHQYSITLPEASENLENTIIIKRNANGLVFTGNEVTINASTGDSIDFSPSYLLSNDFQSVSLISDGSNWFIINSFNQ